MTMLPKLPFFKSLPQENKSEIFIPSRRDFLKISSLTGGALLLGVHFQCSTQAGELITFSPNVYLSITSDNVVSIIAHRSEMGQGIRTSLPLIVADELGADWKKVKIVQAEGNEDIYGNQNTDGSFSVRMFYEPMRQAGAMARILLSQAAAEKWQVLSDECYTENSEVIHKGSGRRIKFGDLVEVARNMELPKTEHIILKDFSEYKMIGKDTPIVDLQDMVTGKAIFGADVDLPDMKIAVIQRCPVVGGKVISFDREAAMKIPGVIEVIKIEGQGIPPGLDKALEGVAVIADNTWSAIKGRGQLNVNWDLGPNHDYDSDKQQDEMLLQTVKDGKVRRKRGDFQSTLNIGGKILERTYKTAFYAHATIEPTAAIAHYKKDGNLEIWAPSQHPQWARQAVSAALDIPLEKIKVNVTLLGGGFGRKSKPDFIVEASTLSKVLGYPVRVQWTRDDDLHHDFYHAHSAQRIKAVLDRNEKLIGWNHHTVFPSIGATSNPAELHPSDGELGLGCVDFPYDVPHIRIETHESKAHTRIGWLRSVSNIHHAFAIGSMMDEIAEARKKDPVTNVLEFLGSNRSITFAEEMVDGDYGNYGEKIEAYPWETGRMKKVIERVANEANWGKNLPENHAIGFAAHKSFLTYVACIVELAKDEAGNITIPEVHYAVDCGIAVNTDRIRSQFEGGAMFATSLATTSKITFKEGRVQQHNFDTHQIIRMPQSPKNIHVYIIESQEKPTGIGEPPVPPFIPALCNAFYKLTGKRVEQLPFELKG